MRKTRWGLLLVALLGATLATAEPARGGPGARFVESFDAVQWWQRWDLDAPPQGTQRWSSVADGNHLRVWFRPTKHEGASWFLDTGAAERVRLRYRVRFGPGWLPVESGKLPGFGRPQMEDGGCLQACGRRAVRPGQPFYSARASYGALNTGASYLYGPRCTGDATATTGTRVAWPGVRFTNGVWYEVEQILTMNTPNRHDGSLLVRIDGTTVLHERGLCLRTSPDVPVGNAWMHFFHGGRLPSLSLTWIDLDDVVVDS